MKKFIITLIIFLPLRTTAQWEILNEGFSGTVNTIDFVNENVGWIAGSNGTLLKTTDGGENWNSINILDSISFNQIDFINESVGYALTSRLILKTNSAGNNWDVVKQFGEEVFLNSIYVVDENNVVVTGTKWFISPGVWKPIGTVIFKTNNSGLNWIELLTLENIYDASLRFQNPETGVIIGTYCEGDLRKGIIVKTNDGGLNWSTTIVNQFNNIGGLQFLDNNNGYFRAHKDTIDYICKTEDMFSSWTIKTQHPYSITSYQYLDNDNAYAIMGDSISSNNVMRSVDGGITWSKIYSHEEGLSFNSIYFNTTINGLLFCSSLGGSIILKSTDSGYNWEFNKISCPFVELYSMNKDTFVVAGGYIICHLHGCNSEGIYYLTKNGGKNWEVYNFTNLFIEKLIVLSNHTIISLEAFCSRGCTSKILKTIDFESWMTVYSTNFDSLGYTFWGSDISFLNDHDGFTIGSYHDSTDSRGAGILYSTDGGDIWELGWTFPNTSNYEYKLLSIHHKNNVGWSVGESGMIIKYTPQTGWVQQPSVTDLPLNKVFFSDNNHGWIAGGYHSWDGSFQNILLKTTNGGENWIIVPKVPFLMRDLAFIDNNFGWAIGYDSSGVGGILKSTDGGNTWIIDNGNLPTRLNAFHIKDGYGWAVGENGLILRTTNAGPTWVVNENKTLPTEFLLEQNYPNPFNPTTKIKYSMPSNVKGETSKVMLRVYDVLGREVATLVNEEKPPGVYEVEFNGANLSSGIYLYRLQATPVGGQAGDFNAVKKMLLLK